MRFWEKRGDVENQGHEVIIYQSWNLKGDHISMNEGDATALSIASSNARACVEISCDVSADDLVDT